MEVVILRLNGLENSESCSGGQRSYGGRVMTTEHVLLSKPVK